MSEELVAEIQATNGLATLPAEFSETSLTLAPGASFDDWRGLMQTLGRIERAEQWWIGDALNQGEAEYGEKYAQAVGEEQAKTWRTYAWVAGRVQTSMRIDISWNHCRVVAKWDDPEPQEYWLEMARTEGWSYRELAKEIKKAYLTEQGEVTGTYRVLYADPPWQYSDDLIEGYGAAEHHYPSMSLTDLRELKVRGREVEELAEDDAVLFLWATSPLLPQALDLMGEWGFSYKASFVWDKVRHNFGHYNSVRHEFLLIGTRGSCAPELEEGSLHDSVVSIERTEHSEKPEEFREIIGTLYPKGRRLELFARTEAAGWDSWGAT